MFGDVAEIPRWHATSCLDKMVIILRLQGLDVKAGAEDIRRFFENLHIPDGGVYIVGGSLGEAFIAFTTERDAQLAMRYNGTSLKGSKVSLHMSNMAELEHKLETLIRKKKSSPTPHVAKRSQPCPNANGLQSSNQRDNNEADPRVHLPKADGTVKVSDVMMTPEPTLNSEPGY
ncbi:hypothetical protein INR49_024079, partial [Caranx melampygus]